VCGGEELAFASTAKSNSNKPKRVLYQQHRKEEDFAVLGFGEIKRTAEKHNFKAKGGILQSENKQCVKRAWGRHGQAQTVQNVETRLKNQKRRRGKMVATLKKLELDGGSTEIRDGAGGGSRLDGQDRDGKRTVVQDNSESRAWGVRKSAALGEQATGQMWGWGNKRNPKKKNGSGKETQTRVLTEEARTKGRGR